MKNYLFNRNLLKVSLLLISITFLFLYSCKNNTVEFSNTDPIADAKAWYLKSNTNKGTVLQSNKGTSQQIEQEIDWDSAKAFKLNDGTDVIGVPVKMILGKVALGGSYMLLIDKVKNNYSVHVAYNSQKDYFKKDVSDEEMIAIYNQSLKANNTPQKSGNGSKLMAVTCTQWYLSTTYYDGDGYELGSTSRLLYTSCSGDLGDYPDADMGGPVDCAGTLAGGAYISDCGCIGGQTGIQQCPREVYVDENVRQCLKDIKAALEALGMKNTSTSSELIASILNKLNLSTGENFNAIIVETTPSDPNNIAATLPPDYNDKTKSVATEIKFNPTYLNKLTDLAVAGVMMHEYIHAYFSWNLYLMERNKQVDPKFKETYDLLFNDDGQINYSPEKDLQHEQMAKSFAGEISAMLKQYAISNQIPLPSDPEYFNKMAWAGLEKTSLYKFAPSGTNATLAAEQGLSGNKITQVIKCKQ
jgi:hypothetical protein